MSRKYKQIAASLSIVLHRFRNNLTSINRLFAGIFVVLLIRIVIKGNLVGSFAFRDAWFLFLKYHYALTNITTILSDLFSIVAISLGGVWTYYVFVKGRTFTSKIKIDLKLEDNGHPENKVVILKTRITNEGKTRVVGIETRLELNYGQLKDGKISFEHLCTVEDLIATCWDPSGKCWLEPDQEMNLALAVWTAEVLPLNSEITSSLMMAKLDFRDTRNTRWRETAIFHLVG